MERIGLFYGSTTIKTAKIAEMIKKEFGEINIELIPIDTAWADSFMLYNNIIVGTSTWFDGELPVYWDEMLAELKSIEMKDQKIAIFGLGDQVNYPENFADGIGILADVFTASGASIVGFTSTKGYTFKGSKAVVEDQFCGLVLDIENQSELTSKRVADWVRILKNEFKAKLVEKKV